MRARVLTAFFCALTVFLVKPAGQVQAQAKEWPVLTCATLEQCLELLQKPYPSAPGYPNDDPPSYSFIDADGGYFSLSSEFEKFGRPGALALLNLLKHPDLSIRARAGMVLSELSTIKPEDLPVILRESRNGNSWIDSALARIGTPEALSELIGLLRKTPDVMTQHGAALEALGNRAIPLLLGALTCTTEQECPIELLRAIGRLASKPGIQSDEIRKRFIILAAAKERARSVREGALQALAMLSQATDADRLQMRALLNDPDPAIKGEATNVLISWSDEAGVKPLTEAIENEKGYDRDIRIQWLGEMGRVAKSAGPLLVTLLQDEDWNARKEAAKAIGGIGYTDGTINLTASISASDWKATYAAIASLKQLGAADDRIRDVAMTYWQPGIRAAAQRLLDGKPEPTVPGRGWQYTSPIDAYCDSDDGKKGASKSGEKLISHPDLFGAKEAGTTIAVEGGTLVAIDMGEWGGALEFRPDNGLVQQLLLAQVPIKEESVIAVVKSAQGIFALTGTGHMGLDNGFIQKIEKAADGKWNARTIWRLPGAPYGAIVSPAGNLGIQTNYGDVIFRPDSGMEWLSCPVRN